MKYVFAIELLICSGIAIDAAHQGRHGTSYFAAGLTLFCLWMYDSARRQDD